MGKRTSWWQHVTFIYWLVSAWFRADVGNHAKFATREGQGKLILPDSYVTSWVPWSEVQQLSHLLSQVLGSQITTCFSFWIESGEKVAPQVEASMFGWVFAGMSGCWWLRVGREWSFFQGPEWGRRLGMVWVHTLALFASARGGSQKVSDFPTPCQKNRQTCSPVCSFSRVEFTQSLFLLLTWEWGGRFTSAGGKLWAWFFLWAFFEEQACPKFSIFSRNLNLRIWGQLEKVRQVRTLAVVSFCNSRWW